MKREAHFEVYKSADGWRWQSSLTRHDTGNGACELLLVQSAAVL